MPRPSFTVSHPAQTEYQVLGGHAPDGSEARAKAALEVAHSARLASQARAAERQAARRAKASKK